MLDKTRLRIAMQKSGRLSDESQELLSRCGIKINLQTAAPDSLRREHAHRYSAGP